MGRDEELSEVDDMELSVDDVKNIKEIFTVLIDQDEGFSDKFQTIIEEDSQPRSIVSDCNISLGITLLAVIVLNLIKAKYPNKIDKDGNTDRGYSNLSETLKSLAEVLKNVK